MNKTFTEKVLEIVRKIPKGSVLSYKEVGIKAGSKNGARAVGTIMKNNYDKNIPCHRVIKSDGTLGEYNRGGTKEKARKLKAEGAFQYFFK